MAEFKFLSEFLPMIAEGESLALRGWWAAAEESLAAEVTAKAYASAVCKDGKAAVKGGRFVSENTVRIYVGACRKAITTGYKVTEFGGIDEVREYVGVRSEKAQHQQVRWTAREKGAAIALLNSPAFALLPESVQAKVRKDLAF